MQLPGGLSYEIHQHVSYESTYPWLNGQPLATVKYTEDFLYVIGDKGWAAQVDTAVDRAVAAILTAINASFPPAAPFVSLVLPALGMWLKYVSKDSHGGITLAFAPHWAGTTTGGIDLNYLGVNGYDRAVKGLVDALKAIPGVEATVGNGALPAMDLSHVLPAVSSGAGS